MMELTQQVFKLFSYFCIIWNTYTVVAAADVPDLVTGYYGAGRMNHGDFSYSFPDNVGNDTSDSAYDATLGGMLDSYKSALVGIFGDENASGGGDNGGGDNGGDDNGGGDTEGVILATFDGSPSHSMFTVGGSYGDGKITYNDTYYKKGIKLDSKGSITFTPTKDYNMVLVLATAKSGRDVKINGEKTTVSGATNTEGAYYEMEPIAITAGTEYVITKGSGESIVMIIKLTPANGGTTSISEELRVKSGEFATAPVYNLNGQRVAKPTKGLYIVNGRKIAIK